MNTPTLLAELTAESIGRLTGYGLVTALLVWGIVKCFKIMRRKTTSATCVASLAIYLCCVVISAVINIAVKEYGWPQFIVLLWSPVGLIVNLAAIIVAIIGFAKYDSSRFNQGKKQAIWGIVLGSISTVSTIALLAYLAASQFNGGFSGTTTLKRESLPEFNCSVSSPPGWMKADPRQMGTDAGRLAYKRNFPEMYMLFIPENLGDAMDFDAYTEFVKKTLMARANAQIEVDQPVDLGAMHFRRVTATAPLEKTNAIIYYENWLATSNGAFWRILIWGSTAQRQAVTDEARKFASEFQILDPDKQTSRKGTLADVKLASWGIETHLAGAGWNPGGKEMNSNSLFRFTAQNAFAGAVVASLRFEKEPPDLEAVARGLLSTMNFKHPSSQETGIRSYVTPLGEGLEISTERAVDGTTYDYLLRVLRHERQAWLAAAWVDRGHSDISVARETLDKITITPGAGPIPARSEAEGEATGLALNEAGLAYFVRKDYDSAAVWFAEAYQQTKSDPAIFGNWIDALEKLGKHHEALALVGPEMAHFPKDLDLAARRAELLALDGDPDAGNAAFLEDINRGFKNEDTLLEWLNQLNDLQRQDLAETAAEAWNKHCPTLRTRRWEAEVVAQAGDRKRAIAMLEKLTAEYPDNDDLACEMGETLNEAEDFERAGESVKNVLVKSPKNVRALQVLGWSQLGRKWYREAKESFEAAAALQPKNEEIQDALREASSALGQGSNSDIKEPLEPVALPEVIAKELKSDGMPEHFGEGEALVCLSRSIGYEFHSGKPLRHTIRRRVKILNQAGVNFFSTIEIPFDPLNERIYINRIQVEDGAGKKIASGTVDDAYVHDAEGPEANARKLMDAPVPGLAPGYILDYEITIQERDVQTDFPFSRHIFGRKFPCAAEAVFVSGDVGRVKHAAGPGSPLKTIESDKLIGWIARNVTLHEDEPLQPGLEARAPTLWLSGGNAPWKEIGKTYLDQIADRLQPDASAAKLAGEICKGLKTDREKIGALAREVQKGITYRAIEFGVRARRPNSASETLRQRSGDCKDHALLLWQLLHAEKIECCLALVQTNWRIQPDLPSLDQFNHMIVHVPALGKTWLLDPTDKELALTAFPARDLWESHALLLDPANPRLIPPQQSVSQGASEVESHRTISPSGNDWLVSESITFSGYNAAAMRGLFAGESPNEQTKQAQSLLKEFGAAELRDFRFDNLDNPEKPAVLSLSYTVRNAIKKASGIASAPPPAFFEKDYLGWDYLPNRRSPFSYHLPFHFTSVVTLKLPSAADFRGLNQHGGADFASWQFEPRGENEIKFEFRAKTGEWPAKDYARFYQDWESARGAWDAAIQWRAETLH